jgi:hypothetical protein
LIGRYSDGLKQEAAAFNDYTYGVSIGGAIVKNKLFYFNAELADRNEAVLNAPGSSTSISQETVNLIADRLKSKYN